MPTSLITKKRIAKAFVQLLSEKDFEKISVSQIMELSHIRRQTFYNYFLDKYDLVEWILKTDLSEQVTDNLEYISGLQLLKELIYFFHQNQKLYQAIFHITGQNDIQAYFLTYCQQIVGKIITDYAPNQLIEAEKRSFVILYHSHALADLLRDGIFGQFQLTELEPQIIIDMIRQSVTQ